MSKAVDTDIAYVAPTIPPALYKSLWDLLCNQLFGPTPVVIDTSSTFPDIQIWWHQGTITMTETERPYTFTIEFESAPTRTPEGSDVILYEGKYYVIRAVSEESETEYECSGCELIDVSIVGVYAALAALNYTVGEEETDRQVAESERAEAESERKRNETARQGAESQRQSAFNLSQAQREAAYLAAEGTLSGSVAGDGSRWGSFKSAEASRIAQITQEFIPWNVVGAVMVDNNHFVADDETDTPQDAYDKFWAGFRVYLTDRNGRTEEIIADDGDYLITLSGWKWKYNE